MAPAVTVDEATRGDDGSALPTHLKPTNAGVTSSAPSSSYPRPPLQLTGALDRFAHEDATPAIGREYPNVNIVDDLLHATNADELIRDLAITSECLSTAMAPSPRVGHKLQGREVAETPQRLQSWADISFSLPIVRQFRNEASSSSGRRTTSQTPSRSSWCTAWAS